METGLYLDGMPKAAEGGPPLPVDVPVERPFWESCRAHAMRLQRCDACGNYRFYPGYVCDRCGKMSLTWTPVSGRGEIHTYSVVHRPAGGISEGPYVWALIELEEGAVMTCNVINCSVEDVRVGLPVEVTYEERSPEWTIPCFQPRQEGARP